MTTPSPETPIPESPEEETTPTTKCTGPTAMLLLFFLTLSAGIVVLLYGHQTQFSRDLDIAFVKASSTSKNKLCDLEPQSKVITIRSLTEQPDRGLHFKLLEITDDPDQVYESSPPSSLDYAVMLHHLHEAGIKNVVLTTRMSWDGDLGITDEALSNKLDAFKRASIGIPLTRGSHQQDLPDILRPSIIPFSNVSGNHRALPIVNQVSIPSAVRNTSKTEAGFSIIESTPEEASTIPLICVWEGEGIVPSLELLALMNAHGIAAKQVTIDCGKDIRLGLDGPVIPIGAYGEIHLPVTAGELSSIPSLKAEQLIANPDQLKDTDLNAKTIYLAHAVGKKTETTNILTTDRLRSIIHWSKYLPVPEPGNASRYHRLPIWAHIIILFDIAIAAWVFSGWSRGKRHFAFILTITTSFPLLLLFMKFTQHWMSCSAFFAAVTIAWLIPVKRQKRMNEVNLHQEPESNDEIQSDI